MHTTTSSTRTTTTSSKRRNPRKKFLFTTAIAFLSVTAALLLSSSADAVPLSGYPPYSEVPPTDSVEVRQWLSEINLTGSPVISPNSDNPLICPDKVPEGVCHWTCEDCAAGDVVTCPDKNVWGLTFNNGPTEATPELLQFLGEQNVKATFFLSGSNVVKLPELVLKEVNAGHHLASYTWSGHALTTLTNEQIVAEIRWTEKAIEQATGYRVRYVRPPYGDVDNRVRYVLKELGYTVVNWSGKAFDSNDSKMPELSVRSVETKFREVLDRYIDPSANNSQGFISVENDISPETVAVAKELIPYGLSKTLKITTVAECLHDTSPYATRTGGV